jgi:hypothetical protein
MARRGRKGNREWKLRNRLTCRADSLADQQLAGLQTDLGSSPLILDT